MTCESSFKVTADWRKNSREFLAHINGNFRFGLVVWIFQEPIILFSLKYPNDSFPSLCVHVERAILWAKCLGVGSEEILAVVIEQVLLLHGLRASQQERQMYSLIWAKESLHHAVKRELVAWICNSESCLRWLRKGFCLVIPLPCMVFQVNRVPCGGDVGFPGRKRTHRWGKWRVGG